VQQHHQRTAAGLGQAHPQSVDLDDAVLDLDGRQTQRDVPFPPGTRAGAHRSSFVAL
jgi:hypothetical protein